MKILISACLLGLDTKYNGKNNEDVRLIEQLRRKGLEFYPLCAEQLGGFPTPREPSEIEKGFNSQDVIEGKGRVLTDDGEDVTDMYIKGAKLILNFCKEFGVTHAILQERSPSCGYTKVYDGTFSGNLISGVGVLTQLLKTNGIKIIELKDLEKFRE